jgi:hypothetical protein
VDQRDQMTETRVCRVCNTEKPITEFVKNGNYYRHDCKACRAAEKVAFKAEHPEKNQEQKNARARRYYGRNPAARRAKEARRHAAHPEKRTARNATHRANKLQRTPPWLTAEHRSDIRRIYGAAADLSATTGEAYQVDHIVPLRGEKVSGLHVPWNLQVLIASENLAKGNRYPAALDTKC